ncbi:hypothetical protein [Kineococcus esterisolvens]|uniref:hypothetical protein n=1 Tax=unclassified Kineococcus TaxID=2621656 RepID=UPI003D7E528D
MWPRSRSRSPRARRGGAAAWGGANPGALPPGLRAASAGSAVAYALLAVTAGSALVPPRARRRVLTGAACVTALGTVMNLASPSLPERVLWTPVAAALTVLLWRSGRVPGGRPAQP